MMFSRMIFSVGLTFYWLILTIFFPEMAYAKNETIESRNLKKLFYQTFKFGGDGNMWVFNKKSNDEDYLNTCSDNGDFGFLTKKISLTNAFTVAIYVTMEISFFNNNSRYLEIYLHNGTSLPSTKDTNFKKFFFKNFSLIYSIENKTEPVRLGDHSTYIFKFHKNASKIVTLAVRGTGVCAAIYSIQLHYYFCEEIYLKGVRFPMTVSPFEGRKKVEVNCSVNSSPSPHIRTLTGLCGYNGTWDINTEMGCFCDKGFEMNSSMQCSTCRVDYFKPISSNESCKPCPAKRTSTKDRTSCKCRQGYYHLKGEPTTSPCFGPITETLEVSVKQIDEKAVNVSWQKIVVEEGLSNSLCYDVDCFLCHDKDSRHCSKMCKHVKYKPSKDNLTQTFVRISRLEPGRRYVFRVYPKTVINIKFMSKNDWNYSESSPYVLSSTPTSKQSAARNSMTYFDYVVVSGIGSGVLFMIMVVLLVIVLKRKSDYRRHLIIENEHQCIVELPERGQKLYIDPTNYDCPQDALSEFTSELDPSVLVLEKLIGGGEFGDVYKGYMKTIDGKSLTVAVKTLRSDHSVKNERDFLLEASVMGQFHDLNVIGLEGVITRSTPRMIVTEYMSNGSLDRFLRINDGKITTLQLIGMARGVASGMAYLSAMNFIHRDLAARNILVDDDLLCKITDFGLSRSLETDGCNGEYNTSGGKIPVRWTAPEAIAYRKFSSASDVWSYGILLWEIMSFGDRPYWEWENYKVLKEVEDGFRLPAPQNCPKAVHNLMLLCWKTNRIERPNFEKITEVTSGWIRSPETMNDEPNHQSVIGGWLHSIKMGDYAPIFIRAGYESPYQLAGIRDEDLLNLGVKLIGHRNKILKAIKAFDETKTDDKVKLARNGSIAV